MPTSPITLVFEPIQRYKIQRNPCAVLVNTQGVGKIQNVRPISRYIMEAVHDSSGHIVGERVRTAFPFRFWRGNAVPVAYTMTATYNTSNRKYVR